MTLKSDSEERECSKRISAAKQGKVLQRKENGDQLGIYKLSLEFYDENLSFESSSITSVILKHRLSLVMKLL